MWEQIDTANSIDELAKKEIKYISDYNSFSHGYNGDKGGGFQKTIYQYSLDGCWNVNHTLVGYFWSYEFRILFKPEEDCRKKKVLQLDLGGTLIKKYDSASEASKKTGISKKFSL